MQKDAFFSFKQGHMRRNLHYVLAVLVMLGGLTPTLAHDDFSDAPLDGEVRLIGSMDLGDKGDSKTPADRDHSFHCSTISHLWISASVAQPRIPRGINRHAITNHRLIDPFSIGPPTPPPNA